MFREFYNKKCLHPLSSRKAQVVMGEYALLIVLTVFAITGMTVFFKRVLQARIRDARWAMQKMVRNSYDGTAHQTTDIFDGTIWLEYEPYYGNRTTYIASDIDDKIELRSGGSSGRFTKRLNDTTRTTTNSFMHPPRDAEPY